MFKNNTKATMIAMILVCLAPIIASYSAYYIFKPTKKVNYGILINPQRTAPSLTMEYSNLNTIKNIQELKGKWILLINNTSDCDENCVKKLYTIRQLRLSQGRQANRIVPLLIINDNNPMSPTLIKSYNDYLANVKFAYISDKDIPALNKWLSIKDNEKISNNIYLIDPNQNLMMYYLPTHEPKGIIRDLSKLLKWSRIG